MPIYEYTCKTCSKDFERLVFGNQEVDLPSMQLEGSKKEIFRLLFNRH